MTTQNMSVCLFGAAPDTGNQGVTALCQSAVLALSRRGIGPITVFDHGGAARHELWRLGPDAVPVTRLGAVNGRRFYRTDNLWQARLANLAGGLGNPLAQAVRQAGCVLDVSGGDSFSDIYGARRFETVMLPKRMALEAGRPLILLPQTYGPFASTRRARQARDVIAAARLAYARDARSFAAMKDLLGTAFDPARHREGVDMAFALPRGAAPAIPRFERPVIGLNVSGLLLNDPTHAAGFGLKTDYQAVLRAFLRRVHERSDAAVILISHVHAPRGHFESDLSAAEALAGTFRPEMGERLHILQGAPTASELKGLIATLDWFCGTRMHATIAALSSGIPAAALAYSGKTAGVFEAAGQGASVLDLREAAEAETVAERLYGLFAARARTKASLAPRAAALTEAAQRQMDEIAAVIAAGMAREAA